MSDTDLVKRIDVLEKRIASLEKGKTKEPKNKRAPSEYNVFMKTQLKELKEKHPEKAQAELMKLGAQAWAEKKAS